MGTRVRVAPIHSGTCDGMRNQSCTAAAYAAAGFGPSTREPRNAYLSCDHSGQVLVETAVDVELRSPSLKPGFIIKRQPGRAFEVVEYCKEKPLPHCKVDVYFHPTTVGAADEDLTFQQPWADRPDRPALHVHLIGMGLAKR